MPPPGHVVDRLSPEWGIVRLPDALLLEIFEELPRNGRLSALCSCKALHFLVARTIYTDVRVLGTVARNFFTTITEQTSTSAIYTTFVRRLHFTVQARSDQTMALFCRSILLLKNLDRLGLAVPIWRSATLAESMQDVDILQGVQIWANRGRGSDEIVSESGVGRRVHLRPDVHEHDHRRALSSLRHLSIEGDSLFAVICVDRVIESIRITQPMNFYEFGDFCHILQGSNYRHLLTHLDIFLAARMMDACECIDELAAVTLALMSLSIGQTREASLRIFHQLVERPTQFSALQVFRINCQNSTQANDLDAEDAHVRGAVTLRLQYPVLRTRLRRIEVHKYIWDLDTFTDKWRHVK
ncbi:hypothetical protein B0H16DRAFT_1733640 [Mycena metata]|uniref:F-box domain-containing protein n=1 Tax=Mycena metata TaxID=1033252 RepID=A0AAD7MS60_9AGAR|nr:hypothetical protein B0H16DRAFT_1733640 [Mycena metata]